MAMPTTGAPGHERVDESGSRQEDVRSHDRFRGVYEDNYHRILGYALRRCRDPEDAADVVRDKFTDFPEARKGGFRGLSQIHREYRR